MLQLKNKLLKICGYTRMMDEFNQWCLNNNTNAKLDEFVSTSGGQFKTNKYASRV